MGEKKRRESRIEANQQDQDIFKDLMGLLNKHKDYPKEQLLALSANIVGRLIACQDQQSDVEYYMQIVSANIEQGNQEMIAELMNSQGSV